MVKGWDWLYGRYQVQIREIEYYKEVMQVKKKKKSRRFSIRIFSFFGQGILFDPLRPNKMNVSFYLCAKALH